jgi:transposase-like protein
MAIMASAVVVRRAMALMTFHRVVCPVCERVQGTAVVHGTLKEPLRRYVCRFCGEVVSEDGWQEVEEEE